MRRACKNTNDKFCFICGRFTSMDQKVKITRFIKTLYEAYFGCHLSDQDKSWAPHIVCKTCVENLRLWLHGKKKCMPFGVPMIWREPTNHLNDCYFCMTEIRGYNKKNKDNIKYPDIASAMRPVQHSALVPIPVPGLPLSVSSTNSSNSDFEYEDHHNIKNNKDPILLTQNNLDDLIRDLGLSKVTAELLGSRLDQHNLLATDTHYSWYRHRQRDFNQFFSTEDSLVYCHDVAGLINKMGKEYKSEEWRLFIDSSTRSLKAVLLHIGNNLASLPVAYSIVLKENYNDMKTLLILATGRIHQVSMFPLFMEQPGRSFALQTERMACT